MSIYLSIDGSVPMDFASNRGWAEFGAWCDGLDVGTYPQLAHLRDHGWSQKPAALLAEVRTAARAAAPKDPNVATVAVALADALAGVSPGGVVTVTDGRSPGGGR